MSGEMFLFILVFIIFPYIEHLLDEVERSKNAQQQKDPTRVNRYVP